ncbi:hypothetical protein [Streptomyces sp. NPDC017964]|uniref:hypothetical protein n=1 Tax=Streptomyces sp. NPDC017964 TaxID=3365022 RepID=UPI00379C6EE0
MVNIDGSVVELHADGTTSAVSKADKSGINILLTEGGGTRTWRPRDGETSPYGVKEVTRTVSSPSPSSPDQPSSRKPHRQRATPAGLVWQQLRSQQLQQRQGHEFVLVGYSKSVHCERSVGYPLLKAKQQNGLQSLYTEREPCQKAPSFCDRWTAKYFDKDLPVTHSQSYDQSLERDPARATTSTGKGVDGEHMQYRKDLRSWYKNHTPLTPCQG